MKTLTQERDAISDAIQVVRDVALKQVELAGVEAARTIEAAGELAQEHAEALALAGLKHGELRAEEARLEPYLQIARSLSSSDPEIWREVPRGMIRQLLVGISRWAEVEGRDMEVQAPEIFRRRITLSSHARLSLSHLLVWSLKSVLTEEERKALSER